MIKKKNEGKAGKTMTHEADSGLVDPKRGASVFFGKVGSKS
jgi:hypothetical protein